MWTMLQSLVLSLGISASVGLGEAKPAALTGLSVGFNHFESRSWLDLSAKHATGEGFLLGQTVMGLAGPVVAGLDYRYRDGGPWHKNVAWGILGAQGHLLGSLVRVTWRPELTHTNQMQALDLLLRTPIPKWKTVLEYRPTWVRYQQKTGVGWTPPGTGFATEVSIGIAL